MPTPTRSSGLFSGLVLISGGILLLLHNYGHLDLQGFFAHWWPLLIIFWGAVKLYERTVGRRFGGADGGRITGGEVLLVLGMLVLLGTVVGYDFTKEKVGGMINMGNSYSFDVDVAPVKAPANARVLVHNGRGDITVRGSDENEIRVIAKKAARSWSESEAERMAKPVGVVISQSGDGFEVRPTGYDLADSRISVDLEVAIPQKSLLSVKSDKGDITVSGISADVSVENGGGDVDVRGTAGDVNVEMRKGDAKIADTKGDVKVSGKGGEIEVTDAGGGLTVDGDFYGPVRADKVLKGVRLISMKTDMTLSALTGHLEAGSGNLDIADAPGNLTVRTRDTEISVDNPGGKVNLDNRNGSVSVRFSSAPKEDVLINNSSSEIALTLPGSASFEIAADCHNCDIDSEFPGLTPSKNEAGDTHLAGKYGSGKGPKITLKTSYGNISIRRTSMAMPPRPPSVPNPPELPHVVPPSTEQ
jgi:hypothetical protein